MKINIVIVITYSNIEVYKLILKFTSAQSITYKVFSSTLAILFLHISIKHLEKINFKTFTYFDFKQKLKTVLHTILKP